MNLFQNFLFFFFFFYIQGGLVGKSSTHYKSSKIPPPDPSLCLSHQSRIKAMYPPENYLFRSPATSPESCVSVSSTSSPDELSNLLHIPNSQSTPNIAIHDIQSGQKIGEDFQRLFFQIPFKAGFSFLFWTRQKNDVRKSKFRSFNTHFPWAILMKVCGPVG